MELLNFFVPSKGFEPLYLTVPLFAKSQEILKNLQEGRVYQFHQLGLSLYYTPKEIKSQALSCVLLLILV